MTSLRGLIASLIIVASSGVARSQRGPWEGSRAERERNVINEIFDRPGLLIRPPGSAAEPDSPLYVEAGMSIWDFVGLDDFKMEFRIQTTMKLQWIDTRLAYKTIDENIGVLTLPDAARIWVPDIFFENEREAHFHDIMVPNSLVKIYPDGKVQYDTRISLVLSCPMDLYYFPVDRNQCEVRFSSYGYTNNEVLLLWRDSVPLTISPSVFLRYFRITNATANRNTVNLATGSYSSLTAIIDFERLGNHYIVTMFVPTAFFVVCSWLSFWLSPKFMTARTIVVMSTNLMIIFFCAHINMVVSPTGYTKIIDIWTGICCLFVFASLLQLGLLSIIVNLQDAKGENDAENPEESSEVTNTVKMRMALPSPHCFDVGCRIAFPATFMIFVIIFSLSVF